MSNNSDNENNEYNLWDNIKNKYSSDPNKYNIILIGILIILVTIIILLWSSIKKSEIFQFFLAVSLVILIYYLMNKRVLLTIIIIICSFAIFDRINKYKNIKKNYSRSRTGSKNKAVSKSK